MQKCKIAGGRGEQKQNVHKKYTTASGSCFLPQPRLAGMKNSLVARALIAIFVRGILAKFSHLQQDRGRTRPSSIYTSPFFLPPCFISRRRPSPSAVRVVSETQRLLWPFPSRPSSVRNDFIKFALIISLGGSALAETTALLFENRAGYAALFLLSQSCTTPVSSQTLYLIKSSYVLDRTVMLRSIQSIHTHTSLHFN